MRIRAYTWRLVRIFLLCADFYDPNAETLGGRMERLYRWLRLNGAQLMDRKDNVRYISCLIIASVFFLIHLMFLIYYYITDMSLLVWVNTGSLVCYCVSLLMNFRTKGQLTSLIITAELSLYCVLSALLVGWRTGAQWYLPVMIFPCYLVYNLSRGRKFVYVGMLSLSMLVCYLLSVCTVPYYADRQISLMVAANAFLCMGGSLMLVYIAGLSNSLSVRYYQEQIDSLTTEANRDKLTGLWNRRYAEHILSGIFANQLGREGTFIAMADIDFFKDVNDTYGHPVGDQVLTFIAHVLAESFRASDTISRWGGEEFLIILRDTSHTGAYKVLENFRRKIERSEIKVEAHRLQVTITVGFASCDTCGVSTDFINNSDTALYYGKRNGRNKVVYYDDIELPANG